MYLQHHYLVDLVGGGCLATLSFYIFLDDTQRHYMEEYYPTNPSAPAPFTTLMHASQSQLALGTRRSEDVAMGPLRTDVESQGNGGGSKGRAAETLFAVEEDEDDEAAAALSRSATPKPKEAQSNQQQQGQRQQSKKDEVDRDSFDDWGE